MTDISHFISEYIQHPLLPHAVPFMSIHASPFQEGLYKIWVHQVEVEGLETNTRALTIGKYHLSLHPETCASKRLQFIRSFRGTVGRGYQYITHITYSGHTEIFDPQARVRRVFSLPELIMTTGDADDNVVELPDSEDYVHTSAYSGALTYPTSRSIVVNYYL